MADTKVIESLLRETISALKNGGAGGSVKEVDALPEITEENKTKIFKLKDEANLYVPALINSTTSYTSRLPDEEQIDKACLYETEEDIYYYKGAYKVICSDGEMGGYLWGEYIVSLKNAETVTQDSGTIYYVGDAGGVFDNVNKTITIDTDLATFKSENGDDGGFMAAGVTLVCATYNAPESAQIDSATLVAEINQEERTFKYVGNKTIIQPGTGDIEVYTWADTQPKTGYKVYSTNKASEIYGFVKDTGFYYGDTVFWVMFDWDDYGAIRSSDISSLSILPLNAPDEEQIGKAYIIPEQDYNPYLYTGVQRTARVGTSDTYITLYEYYWTDGESSATYGGPKAEMLHDSTTKFPRLLYSSQTGYYWDTSDNYAPKEIYTVPYQRAQTTEYWDYVSAFPVIEKRVLMKYMGDSGAYMNLPTEGFVNVNGETMEYKGKTYYKWVCIEETTAGKSRNRDVLDENQTVLSGQTMILLTTSLDPDLPFSPESPEWAYVISSEDVEDFYNAQTAPIAQEAYIDKFGNMTIRV